MGLIKSEINILINKLIEISSRNEICDKELSKFYNNIKEIVNNDNCHTLYYLELLSNEFLINKYNNLINNKFFILFLAVTNKKIYKELIPSRKILSELIYEEKRLELGDERIIKSIYFKLK